LAAEKDPGDRRCTHTHTRLSTAKSPPPPPI
jgi:hypothetical protein